MPLVSFKTSLRLNNKQATLAAKHAGTARHAYNWGLALCKQLLEEKQKLPTAIDLHKRLVAEVKTANPWYYEVSKCAPQEALRHLATAFKNCFKHKHTKFPRFKKKGVRDSFYLEGSIKISGDRIKIPIFGWVKCDEILPAATPKNVTVSRRADRWYISFRYELAITPLAKSSDTVGVDIGINSLATCNSGKVFPNPKAYRKYKRKLARLQRNLCRKVKGSKNRAKAVVKVARLHRRIADIRKDNLHKLTSYLAKNHGKVVIEDLNISGMLKNHRLASAIADCGFYEFKRQLTYKCDWYSTELVIADRWYPSSQLCSNCGNRQKMPLSQRTYHCTNCGVSLDRDLNASINLSKYCSTTTSSVESKAWGEVRNPNGKSVRTSANQEENTIIYSTTG